ncbi:MAG: SDR family NAD(P)-dependent oxidoreductase, partial [Candidatus Heimdallarchaeota archaeon]
RWHVELRDKVVIVTGASSGIGLEIARLLAAGGVKIALAARSKENLENVAAELSATGAILTLSDVILHLISRLSYGTI